MRYKLAVFCGLHLFIANNIYALSCDESNLRPCNIRNSNYYKGFGAGEIRRLYAGTQIFRYKLSKRHNIHSRRSKNPIVIDGNRILRYPLIRSTRYPDYTLEVRRTINRIRTNIASAKQVVVHLDRYREDPQKNKQSIRLATMSLKSHIRSLDKATQKLKELWANNNRQHSDQLFDMLSKFISALDEIHTNTVRDFL